MFSDVKTIDIKNKILNIIRPDKKAKALQQADRIGFSYDEQVSLPEPRRALSCLIRGLMLFLIVFTPISILNDAFEIKEAPAILPFILILFSIAIAFINYNGLARTAGYIIFFIIFTLMSISMFRYINSGLNAILNIIFEKAAYELNLEAIRTYDEAIKNRAMTISVFYIYIGIVLLLLNNYILNNFMSAPFVFVLTFPFLFLAFYFEYTPKIWHYLSYAFLLMTICIMKNTNQFNLPDKKSKLSVIKRKVGHNDYKNVSNGTLMWQTAGFITALLVCLYILSTALFPQRRFSTPSEWRQLKQDTKEYARLFFKEGLSGFFGSDGSAGVGYGALGNGRVTPSYETDLVITFAPKDYNPIYLKTYVGTTYTGSSWDSAVLTLASILDQMDNKNARLLAQKWPDTPEPLYSSNEGRTWQRIDISTVGAAGNYYPYYTEIPFISNKTTYTLKKINYRHSWLDLFSYRQEERTPIEYYSFPEEDVRQYDYTPDISKVAKAYFTTEGLPDRASKTDLLPDSKLFLSESRMLDNLYLSVCDPKLILDQKNLRTTLDTICKEQNFHGTALEIAEQVQDYLKNNFTYSMNPGRYDSKKYDYVSYFLEVHHYGYCQHFATAATLLLRNMGIPARYVEGYCVSFDDISRNYKILEDENISDWIRGSVNMDTTSVLTVEVPDASAHAWVEIWLPDFGWYPIEVTNAPFERSDEEDFAFWENLSNAVPRIDVSPLEGLMNIDWKFSADFIKKTFLIILCGLLILFVIFFARKWIVTYSQKQPDYHNGLARKLILSYQQLCQNLYRLKAIQRPELLHSEFKELVLQTTKDIELSQRLQNNLNIITYGDNETSKDLYTEITSDLKFFDRLYQKNLPVPKQIIWRKNKLLQKITYLFSKLI